ncbi:MAG: hypothetical protein ACYC33_10635 [Thermoleophilia bacterium]
MIVSEIEILKVLGLRTGEPLCRPAPASPTTTVMPADERCLRLRDLRCLLDRGEYQVTPVVVAEKMVGRAICDQVARLYDA